MTKQSQPPKPKTGANDADKAPAQQLWDIQEEREGDLERFILRISPRNALAGIAVALALVIALVTYMIYQRSVDGMAGLLAEKGAALINVFEGALRTGMRGSAGLQVQVLLDEIARSKDIEFVAVTMPDGTIIAHSDINRLGELLRVEDDIIDSQRIAELDPGEKEKWLIVQMEGKRVFLIYRHFTLGKADWDKDVPEPTIFLGLEVSPFEITNSQNRSFVAMLAVATMLVSLLGLLALSSAQKASESRRRQLYAEGEMHRLEGEMRRNEKLAAIGTLAAGVAHEIRNPLSSIKGYATWFRQKFPEGEEHEAASVMVNEVNRLNRVISDLLGLSRPDDVQLKTIGLDTVAEHVIRLVRHNAADRNVSVSLHIAPKLPKVMGDMERVSQALLNICLNAIEAMPGGGSLLIAVAGGRRRAWVIVRDTGQGIPPEIMNRIFDPYFTTKGSGTGLGLPMAHKIVRAHGGGIEASSRLAREGGVGGTVFRIWLPVAADGAAAA